MRVTAGATRRTCARQSSLKWGAKRADCWARHRAQSIHFLGQVSGPQARFRTRCREPFTTVTTSTCFDTRSRIYLDPPFNSDRTYNILHKGSDAQQED